MVKKLATGTLYSRAGLAFPENGGFESDQKTIQTFWQSVMDLGIKEAKLENIEAEGNSKITIKAGLGHQFADDFSTLLDDYLNWIIE